MYNCYLWRSYHNQATLDTKPTFLFYWFSFIFVFNAIPCFPEFCFGTYRFVTHEDICNAFRGETLLAVLAPAGTQLEVPLPEMVSDGFLRTVYINENIQIQAPIHKTQNCSPKCVNDETKSRNRDRFDVIYFSMLIGI